MTFFLSFLAWLLGASATVSAIFVLSERRRDTFGDAFIKYDSIFFFVIVFWPFFWPCYFITLLTERVMIRFMRDPAEK